jgi:predicted membrane GTPase involved in stress response
MLNRKPADIGIVAHFDHGKTTIDAAMMVVANQNTQSQIIVIDDTKKKQLNLNDISRTEPIIIKPYYKENEYLEYKCGREKRRDRRKNKRKK